METAGLLLVISMCLVGALIAYAADLLGRNLGKKRLSLFGLRPRHTAALLTTVAGGLIPVVTIAFLWSSVKDVRVMLSEGSRAASERDRKVAELKQATDDLNSTGKKVQLLEDQAKRLGSNIGKLNKENAELMLQRDSAQSNLSRAKQQQSLLERSASALKKEVSGFKSQVQKGRKEISQLMDTRQILEGRIKDVQLRIQDLNEYQIRQDLELQNLERTRKSLDSRITQLESEKQLLENTSEGFLKQIDDLRNQRKEVEKQINEVQTQRQKLQEEVLSLNALRSELIESLGAVRLQPIVYGRGDEVGRIVVPAGSTESETRYLLSKLFRLAETIAEERGAKPVDRFASVSLIPLTNPDGTSLSIDQQETRIVRAASQQSTPQLLILSTLVNSFAGEFVRCGIDVVPNTVVYRQGQLIAEFRIDGSLDSKQILTAFQQFITQTVAPAALKSGMIPIRGADSPLGEVNDDETVSLVNEIREYGRTVRVQALASTEIRRGDRLSMTFRLR